MAHRKRPDFGQLETFLKVVETRSFAEAARQLGVSQPAVSQTVAKLEEVYGGDLFERRRGATIVCTSAAVPLDGIVYRPIVDGNALIAAEAIWLKTIATLFAMPARLRPQARRRRVDFSRLT